MTNCNFASNVLSSFTPINNGVPMKCIATTLFLFTSLLSGVIFSPNLIAQDSGEKTTTGLRVGTFDSRAIAVAYYRSSEFKTKIEKMHADLKVAEREGDSKRVAELQKRARNSRSTSTATDLAPRRLTTFWKKSNPGCPPLPRRPVSILSFQNGTSSTADRTSILSTCPN